jgi:hypothetical protein
MAETIAQLKNGDARQYCARGWRFQIYDDQELQDAGAGGIQIES